jgi:hypothetical protein
MHLNTADADDCDFNEEAWDQAERDQDHVVCLLLELKTLLDDKLVNSRAELGRCTQMLYGLEGLHINRRSDANDEIQRLKRIWKHRLEAQDDIDRWMIAHGHPLY